MVILAMSVESLEDMLKVQLIQYLDQLLPFLGFIGHWSKGMFIGRYDTEDTEPHNTIKYTITIYIITVLKKG